MMVIAIDGPAGSGKSTAARLVAKKMNFSYIDSGAIYRAYTLQFLRSSVKLDDDEAIERLLDQIQIDVDVTSNGCLFFVNGQDVTTDIRSLEVTSKVSFVSELPKVREVVTRKLRKIAEDKSIVLEGRDIGTVVFPDADLKFFMNASIKERASRRFIELKTNGINTDLDKIEREIAKRDKHDSERKLSPLSKAYDAILLNNTTMSIEEGVDFIVNKARKLLT